MSEVVFKKQRFLQHFLLRKERTERVLISGRTIENPPNIELLCLFPAETMGKRKHFKGSTRRLAG